ncbi:unnamed protein product [Trichogramma brassicae]|uniref:DBC1/CARP1 catalytically inactive NUDIX hydrolase domain-containing protein n=1 Tax=Trichogramma brassicae TaxID=86971 RepID=A0A6H5IZ06_9HYME|nr:unnamed protein product [Trichogramma brassicae]
MASFSACVKGSNPAVGDRVLVEASFSHNMPLKWNATRIQVLPMGNNTSSANSQTTATAARQSQPVRSTGAYSAVPPPSDSSNSRFSTSNSTSSSVNNRNKQSRVRERSPRDRRNDDDEIERKRRREDRIREREKKEERSPSRSRRSKSPRPRRRTRVVPRYMVQIPKISLDLYRFLELYYRRSESSHHKSGKPLPSRVETVILFLPDVWRCVPTRLEWDSLNGSYRRQLERKLSRGSEPSTTPTSTTIAAVEQQQQQQQQQDATSTTSENNVENETSLVNELRSELAARNLISKGLKSQLQAKLTKALKSEKAKEEGKEESDENDQECPPSPADEGIDEKDNEKEYEIVGVRNKQNFFVPLLSSHQRV